MFQKRFPDDLRMQQDLNKKLFISESRRLKKLMQTAQRLKDLEVCNVFRKQLQQLVIDRENYLRKNIEK